MNKSVSNSKQNIAFFLSLNITNALDLLRKLELRKIKIKVIVDIQILPNLISHIRNRNT
jgi:hypothetical protein